MSRGKTCRVLVCLVWLAGGWGAARAQDLFDAAARGDLALLQRLAPEERLDAVRKDDGSTPLGLAALGGHEAVVEWLLANGVDPNPDGTGINYGLALMPPVSMAAIMEAGKEAAAPVDAQRFARRSRQVALAAEAAGTNGNAGWRAKERIVFAMLDRERALGRKQPAKSSSPPLALAAAGSYSERLLEGLIAVGCDPNEVEPLSREAPLARAALWGRLDAMRVLLRHGAKVDALSGRNDLAQGSSLLFAGRGGGGTPLIAACAAGQAGAVRLLLEAGADVDKPNWTLGRPVHFAVTSTNREVLALLLRHHADVRVADVGGATPLHLASRLPDVAAVQQLLDAGADIEAPDNEGFTPLLNACEAGQLEVVKFLVARGADLRAQTLSGEGALHAATAPDAAEVLAHLLGLGVPDRPARGAVPVFERACLNGSYRCAAILLAHGSGVDTPFPDTSPPVEAVFGGFRAYRLEHGRRVAANVGAPDGVGNLEAPEERERKTCETLAVLLRAGASPNRHGARNDSMPLHHAAELGLGCAVDLLLAAGADPQALNGRRETPAQMADRVGQPGIASRIRDAAARPPGSAKAPPQATGPR